MNLQQLQYFKVVAEIGHMTKASEILHISQPALSMSISSLEGELGVSLFEKKGRLLQLTQYGAVFLEHISTALQEIDFARAEVERIALCENRTIHISSTYSLSSSLLPGIVQTFREKNPETVIHIQQGPNMELLQNAADSKTDFVFGRIVPDPAGHRHLKYLQLFSEELMILMSYRHPLADRQSIALEELKDEEFVFFHESTGYNLIVMELFQKASFQPNIRYEVYDNSTCAALVSANMCIALVGATSPYDSQMVRKIKISSPQNSETSICIAWNEEGERRASALYLKFLEHVRNLYNAG